MKTHTRIAAMLFLMLFEAVGAALYAAVPPTVPVHVMTFTMHEHGVVEPQSWRTGDWWDLRPAAEDELTAAIGESDDVRTRRLTGSIAVRAYESGGKTIFRTIVDVTLLQRTETEDAFGRPSIRFDPIADPLFVVVVPVQAVMVELEGWQPATRSRFVIDDLKARFQPRTGRAVVETSVPPIPTIPIIPGFVNVLMLGDGFQDNADDRRAFSAQVKAFKQRLYETDPYARYGSFFNIQLADGTFYVVSRDSGANHPLCSDHSQPDPLAGNTPGHNTAFSSSFCRSNTQRLMSYDADAVTRAVAARVTGGLPDIVIILVNDTLYGGAGGQYAIASANAASPFIAIHEVGHSFFGLADEYTTQYLGYGACSDQQTGGGAVACEPNVTTDTTHVKWQRWIDASPTPTCPAAQTTCTATGIGLYEGARYLTMGMWRSERECLMRSFQASVASQIINNWWFCHACVEQHIRKLYAKVDPAVTKLETRRLSLPRLVHSVPPAPVDVGTAVSLGAQFVDLGIPVGSSIETDPPFKFQWRVHDQPIGEMTSFYTFVPSVATTTKVELEYDDPTPLLRDGPVTPAGQPHVATNRKPDNMHKTLTWEIESRAHAHASSSGTTAATGGSTLLAPIGTQNVTLSYTVATAEPGGGRPGDFWSVTVGYADASAALGAGAGSDPIFHEEGVISDPKQNINKSVSLKVDAAASERNVVVEVIVKNLETENFLPTDVDASLSADPVECGTACGVCATTPTAPGCPIQFSIKSATLLPADPPDRNHGDSSYFSLGEKLDGGRNVILKLDTPPGFTSIRATIEARRADDSVITRLRDITWFNLPPYQVNQADGLAQGFRRNDSITWNLDVLPRKVFTNDIQTLPVYEPGWSHEVKLRITLVLTAGDGRTAVLPVDVDRILSGSNPQDPVTIQRPLHALWHEPVSQARWHYWASLYMHEWLSGNASLFHVPDRIADENGSYDTPLGHEFGDGITEVPYYPGSNVWAAAPSNAYAAFLVTAGLALNGNSNTVQQSGARDELADWVSRTRAHVDTILQNNVVSQVNLGTGGNCGGAPPGHGLPNGWLQDLLSAGTILGSDGTVLLDISDRVGGIWPSVLTSQKLTFSCMHNEDIDILVDRCKLGELRVQCVPGRTILKRTQITAPPQPVTIDAGQTASLTVGAEGDDLHYQWYVGSDRNNPHALVGQTQSALSVGPASTSSYWVAVSGANGSDESVPVMVTVRGTDPTSCQSEPVITQQPPPDEIINSQEAAYLTATATGNGLRYQWYQYDYDRDDYTLLDGATLPSYTTTVGGVYIVRISNECGFVDSQKCVVIVGNSCASPGIEAITQDTAITIGQSVDLSVHAMGKTPMTYGWMQWIPNSNPTTISTAYHVTVTPSIDGTQYTVELTNECGRLISLPITISVCTPPAITTQPATPTFTAYGQSAVLTVAATGSDLQYQWFVGGVMVGDNSPSLLVGAPSSTMDYYVDVHNGCGDVLSSHAVLSPPCSPASVNQLTPSHWINAGDSVLLSVSVDATPVTYQWYQGLKGDTSRPIAGATGSTCAVRPVEASSSYWVAITKPCGATVRSETIALAICSLPVITGQPASVAAQPPVGADLVVSASGDELTYQWYVGQSGDTTTKLPAGIAAILHAAPGQTTSYWCRVGTTCGAGTAIVDSASATVYVCAPVITQQPVALPSTVQQGSGTSTITVAAGGTGDHYQWYIGSSGDKSQPVGGDSATLVTPVIQQPTSFWVEVTSANGYCTEDSQRVTVSVCTPPSLSWPSEGTGGPHTTVSMNYSQTIQIAVTPAGTPVVFYKGQSGDTSNPLSGAAQANYGFGISPSATTSYWVRAFSNGCTADSPTLTVNVCVPNITAQPAGTTIASGQSAMLTVAADLPGVSYQWYAGVAGTTTSPVAGGTSPSLTISPSATTTYWCRVTSSCTTKDSSAATVTVCAPPFVSSTPQTVYTTYNTSTAISISATGTSLTYQWYSGASGNTATPLAGKTSPSMTVQLTQTGQYWCRVTSSGVCTANSGTVTVDVCQSPTITTQPASTAIAFNTSTTLSIAATAASGSVTYQWYRGGAGNVSTPVSTSASVNTGALTADTQYWCRVTRGACTTDSNVATVTVCALTVSVAEVNARAGVAVTLTASATGSHVPSPTYTWYQGNSGDTSILVNGGGGMSQLQVAPAATTHYWVRVNDGSCTANSNTATVSVCIPTITTQPANTLVTAGHSTTLTVTATGSSLTYQWYTGASGTLTNLISGATASSLSVTPAATTSYWVLVGGCGGTSANSATATVTVCTPPSIFPTQRDYNFVENQAGVITVQIGSTPSPTYQWYSGLSGDTSHPVSGGTGYQLTVSGYQPQHYWCRVWSNGSCSSDSTTFNVNYCYLGITTQPATTSVAYGTSTTLSLGVSNLTGTPAYQWYVGNSGDMSNPIPGANGATFNTGAVYLTESFWCAAVQGACSVSSDTATVTVAN
jgi:hypothetical protein